MFTVITQSSDVAYTLSESLQNRLPTIREISDWKKAALINKKNKCRDVGNDVASSLCIIVSLRSEPDKTRSPSWQKVKLLLHVSALLAASLFVC